MLPFGYPFMSPACCPVYKAPRTPNSCPATLISLPFFFCLPCASDLARFEEATHRTTRWLDRCIAANKRPHEQNLFPIVQVTPQGRHSTACHALPHLDTP